MEKIISSQWRLKLARVESRRNSIKSYQMQTIFVFRRSGNHLIRFIHLIMLKFVNGIHPHPCGLGL
jgi:hypothetical protein